MSLSTSAKRRKSTDWTGEGWELILALVNVAWRTGRLSTMDRRQVINAIL